MSDMTTGPVHHLENVPGEPGKVKTACGAYKWRTQSGEPMDESKLLPHTVTCPECLEVMADTPSLVEVFED